MFDKVVRAGAAAIPLWLAGAQQVLACNASGPPDDGIATVISLGALGTGILITGIAIAARPKKPQSVAEEDGSTTTLPAS